MIMTSNTSADHHRYYAFARQALVEALTIAGVKNGDSVLIPALICKDVVAAIHTVGATPSFYNVTEALRPVNFPSSPRTTAVIAVNYFGFAQDLGVFRTFCSEVGATLIEDNAHGYLSADNTGALLGTRASMGVTSIRKTIRIPDGAQLSISDSGLLKLAPAQLPFRHQNLGPRFTLQAIILNVQKIVRLPLLRWSQVATRKLRRISTGTTLPISPPNAEFEKIVVSAPRDSSMRRVTRLNIDKEIKRRRLLYNTISQLVTNDLAIRVYDSLPEHCSPYGFPFYGDLLTARLVDEKVRHLGVEVISWPDLPESVSTNAPDHYKRLWLVNFL